MEEVASRPAIVVMESFQSWSGFRTNGNSPGCVKVEYSGAQPWGLKSPTKRGIFGRAATLEEGVCAGDYDNDGYTDLFVTFWGHDVLLHNNGNGTFTDVTRKAGLWHDDVLAELGLVYAGQRSLVVVQTFAISQVLMNVHWHLREHTPYKTRGREARRQGQHSEYDMGHRMHHRVGGPPHYRKSCILGMVWIRILRLGRQSKQSGQTRLLASYLQPYT